MDELEKIKKETEKTGLLKGEHLGCKWVICLGIAERYGQNLREYNSGYCRFNAKNNVVALFLSRVDLETFKRRFKENEDYLSKAIPAAEKERQKLWEACKETPKSIENFPDPMRKALGRLPWPRLGESCAANFEFSLKNVHGLIIREKARFDAGDLPRRSLWPIYDGVSDFQPCIRLEFGSQ